MSLVIVETDTGEEFPIVYCKDCKYYKKMEKEDGDIKICRNAVFFVKAAPDDFCSRGEECETD